MSRDEMVAKIKKTATEGGLLNLVFGGLNYASSEEEGQFVEVLCELHNKQEIDLLQIISEKALAEVDGFVFFKGQNRYCQIIPKILGDTKQLLSAVVCLIKRGGQDMMAGRPAASFREWCKHDRARSEEVLQLSKSGYADATKLLPHALTAGNMMKDALALLTSGNDDEVTSAVQSLGQISYTSAQEAEQAVDAIGRAFDSSPSAVLAIPVLFSIVDIAVKVESFKWRVATPLVERLLEVDAPEILFTAARLISFHNSQIDKECLGLLLSALKRVLPEHQGTLREIDMAMCSMLRSGMREQTIAFLTEFLKGRSGDISIGSFSSASHQLAGLGSPEFGNVVRDWLLDGHFQLGSAIQELAVSVINSEVPLEFNLSDSGLMDEDIEFMARKAVGFLFFHPILAGSVLVEAFRNVGEDKRGALVSLMFEGLVINYGGKLVDYLKSIDESDLAYPSVQYVLAQNQAYLSGLREVSEIAAFHPSAEKVQIQRERWHDKMIDAFREARKGSIFSEIVSSSTLLYGETALSYHPQDDGSEKAVEIPMGSIGHEAEMPRMSIFDPVGLDLTLRILRLEQRKE